MMSEGQSVILFFSSSHALRAEKLLKQAGVSCRLVPVPRHLSSDCGVCAQILSGDIPRARETLEKGRVEIEGVHSG